MVDAIVQIFDNKKEFRLGISPEGTRKKSIQMENRFLLHSKRSKSTYSNGYSRF